MIHNRCLKGVRNTGTQGGIQMTNYSQFKLAAIQAAPLYFDPTASIIKACRFIQKAGEQDAAIVAFGECWLPGYPFFVWGEYAPNNAMVTEYLASARPEIGKNEISGHQKNKIPVAATQQR
jgi:hypothetical protein